MLKSNRELFDCFKVIDTTWRKWSRAFLPAAPETGLRKGKARMYNAEEAFQVWAGGRMLNEKNMTYEEAGEALDQLESFMLWIGLFPIKNSSKRMSEKINQKVPGSWRFLITRTVSGNSYSAKGMVSLSEKKDTANNPLKSLIIEEYCMLQLSPKPENLAICTVDINLTEWITEFCILSGFELLE